jgi:hypothetical protein
MRSRAIHYSADELAWIEANKTMFRTDAHKLFVATFDRPDVSFDHYKSLCTRNGWLTGRVRGEGCKGRNRIYGDEHLAFIRETAELSRKDGHAAFIRKFERPDMSLSAFVALRKVLKVKTGRTGHFPKGHEPWTKGKKLPFNKNSARTQFKPGQQPHNSKFAGHERVDEGGYVYISVKEPNPRTGFERRYVHKHRWLWEQANGPIPEGMVLKCLDGNKQNSDPANWEAIPRDLLPRLNGIHGRGYDAAPAEIKPTIMAVAKLERLVRNRGK